MRSITIYNNGLTGTLTHIPTDVAAAGSNCRQYMYRTIGGTIAFQATRKSHPDDRAGEAYFGEWEDTTAIQYALEHNGKQKKFPKTITAQSTKATTKTSKEDEIAKALALLAILKGGD